MSEVAWQVFKWRDGDPQDPVDGRDPGALEYVGRIVKPDDSSSYWAPDAVAVGERFGHGQFFLFDDESMLDWQLTSEYGQREPIFLDVVGEVRYSERRQEVVK